MLEENRYLTIAEISRRTNISERSLRRYRDKFQVFIPYRGEGRKRVYAEEAIPILKRIAELKGKGKTGIQIGSILSGEVKSINVEPADRQAAGRQTLELTNFGEIIKALPAFQEENQKIFNGILRLLQLQEHRIKQIEDKQKLEKEIQHERRKPKWKWWFRRNN
jgi:DNA-binding transcriptional MerR regulator